MLQIEELRQRRLECVGWYHSHPTFPVLPSSIDVFNQHAQQVANAGTADEGGATPCIAAIVGPYCSSNSSTQSSMSWFYVENRRSQQFSLAQTPEATLQHMVPKQLVISLDEEAEVALEALLEGAAALIQTYSQHRARVDLTEVRFCLGRACHSISVSRPTDAPRARGGSTPCCCQGARSEPMVSCHAGVASAGGYDKAAEGSRIGAGNVAPVPHRR